MLVEDQYKYRIINQSEFHFHLLYLLQRCRSIPHIVNDTPFVISEMYIHEAGVPRYHIDLNQVSLS
jgi:hypothetical protein